MIHSNNNNADWKKEKKENKSAEKKLMQASVEKQFHKNTTEV